MIIGHILMSKGHEFISVAPDDKIQTAAKLLGSKKTGLAVVAEKGGRLLGVISAMDIMRALGDRGEAAATTPVSAIMTTKVCVCRPQDGVQQALEQMVQRKIRHLPVVEDGIVKGVIKLRDAVEFRVGEVEVEAEELRRYIFGAGYH